MSRFQLFRTEQHRIQWRLLGANNRVLGVSIRDFATHAEALAELETLRQNVPQALLELERVPSGLWCWQIRLVSGTAIAQSARDFARKVDAMLAGKRFQQRATTAEMDFRLAVFRPGRRGRGVPFDPAPANQTISPPDEQTYGIAAIRP